MCMLSIYHWSSILNWCGARKLSHTVILNCWIVTKLMLEKGTSEKGFNNLLPCHKLVKTHRKYSLLINFKSVHHKKCVHFVKCCFDKGGHVGQVVRKLDVESKVLSSIPALTINWICNTVIPSFNSPTLVNSRWSAASHQMGFLTSLCATSNTCICIYNAPN